MNELKKKPSVADRIIQSLQEFTEALEKGEDLSKRFTVRTYRLNLAPKLYDAKKVKNTRKLLEASQAVFAQLLGVSVKTVRSWEQGVNTPNGMACRFLDEIQRNPTYWIKRLEEATELV